MRKMAQRLVLLSLVAWALAAAGAWMVLALRAPPAVEPQIFLQQGHADSVSSVAWSPDGRTLASASDDHTVKLWDRTTGRVRATLTAHTGKVLCVAWSPDGRSLASASNDGTVLLWDAATGHVRAKLADQAGAVSNMAWSPDGHRLAMASDDNTVKLWTAPAGQDTPADAGVWRAIEGHTGRVWGVAWSPDGLLLASASADSSIRLWNMATDRVHVQATMEEHAGQVLAVAWSPDGRSLASASEDNTIRLWDMAPDRVHKQALLNGHLGAVSSVAWSPDGRSLASASHDKTVKLWDVAQGRVRETLTGHADWVSSVAWSPDGRSLASASDDNTVKLWEAGTGRLQTTLEGHVGEVWSVAWSPDGHGLASAAGAGAIQLWDAATGRLRATLKGHAASVLDVAWSPDGASLASAGEDTTVKLWDTATGGMRTTPWVHTGKIRSVAWSPDGYLLASSSDDRTVLLWDRVTGRVRATLAGHSGPVLSVAWAPDGLSLASASSDHTVKLWDVATGRLRRTLRGHAGEVWSVAWSPDGRSLASASSDHSVGLWDAAAGDMQRLPAGHAGRVLSVAWSPDGRSLASASDDKTVMLWDVAERKPRTTLKGHSGRVLSVAWSPDGRSVVSGAADGTLMHWSTEGEGRWQSRIVLDAGHQFLALYAPPVLRYRSSRPPGEVEPAAVRFNGTFDNAYPLHYYRRELLLADGDTRRPDALETPKIEPAFVRKTWDEWEDKSTWLVAAGTLNVALVVAVLALGRSRDPFEVAKTFLGKAYAGQVRQLGAGLLRLGGAGQPQGHSWAVLWDPSWATATSAVNCGLPADAAGKLYVIYAGNAPDAAQLAALRGCRAGQVVVPLASHHMARALAEHANAVDALRVLEEPFVSRPDPYEEDGPVQNESLFFGRQTALAAIPQALLQGQHVGLFGLRKVGKTSLVNRLRNRMAAHPCVWIDCEGHEAVANDLYAEIVVDLRTELKRLGISRLPSVPRISGMNEFRAAFMAQLHAWRKHSAGGRVVLLLDEVDKYFPHRSDPESEPVLRAYVAVFSALRALAQEHHCLSVLAVAYRPHINRQNLLTSRVGENPMFMAYHEYFLGFLSMQDTVEMLRQLGAWQDIGWEDAALALVHQLSGGHPLVARQIASDACDHGRSKSVTLADVQAVEREICSHFSRHRIGHYINESIWQLLRPKERAVLSRIAIEPGIGAAELGRKLDGALVVLQQFGLVEEAADGALRLRGTLLEAWMQRNGSFD